MELIFQNHQTFQSKKECNIKKLYLQIIISKHSLNVKNFILALILKPAKSKFLKMTLVWHNHNNM